MTLPDRILGVMARSEGLFTDADSRVGAAMAIAVGEPWVVGVEASITVLCRLGLLHERVGPDRLELTDRGREYVGLPCRRRPDGIDVDFGDAVTFFVPGEPLILSTSKRLELWRQRVSGAARAHALLFDGPLSIDATFYFPRPKSVAKRKYVAMTRKPTTANLDGVILQALAGRFFTDPFQVTDVAVHKRYARTGQPSGVRIAVRSTPPDEEDVA